jgi:hypothetical protein
MSTPIRLRTFTPPFAYLNRLDGKTKEDFEIVIARYDEDIGWSDNYKAFRTVYNKGNEHDKYDYITLENKGHLADTILRHIVDRYDNLATVTFFTHGAFNYRRDQTIRENWPCCALWRNFVSTEANHLMCIKQGLALDYMDSWYNYPESVGSVYERFFKEPYNKQISWARGKWLSVGKRHILSRSKSFYQDMLDWVLSPYEGKEPSQHIYRTRGIFIERFILHAFTHGNWNFK